ncbi:hypothetical protein SteCoe_29413 [Stentor coeruleus]|uniref:Uncharacterized protein n=1 Tax=Stentor coeruleus TaxID=5963 RepID=A0A1R2B623_9CILI|nr:hypothetical protein SteCoe_29413 [Stentor coeruleus]
MHKNTSDIYDLVMDYNKSAIQALQQGNFPTAHEDLSQAKLLLKNQSNTQKILKLKAITYNNFGCFYKRQGRLQKALAYLIQALNYESKLSDDMTNISGTYLNISIIYSEIDELEPALEYAIKAINNSEDKFKETDGEINALIVAYQNIGNLHVKMGKDNEGRKYLIHAYELAVKYYGVNDPMTVYAKNQIRNSPEKEKEKANPIIERMLNYFEKHMGQSRSKRYRSMHNPPYYQPIRKDLQAFTHRPKQQSLQPITDYQLKNTSPSSKVVNKSPSKGTFSTRLPKQPIFYPVSSSKKTFFQQNSSKPTPASKSKGIISQTFPSQQRLKVKSPQKPKIVTKSTYHLIPQNPINTKIAKISDKLSSFRNNLSIFHKNFDDIRNSSVLSNNQQILPLEKYSENSVNKAIIIQKHVRGYFTRKNMKKLDYSARVIQRKYRNYAKKAKVLNKKAKAREFSQQFSQSILKKERDEVRKPKDESMQTFKKTLKKRSFIEKILFIQKHVRDYLRKKKCI